LLKRIAKGKLVTGIVALDIKNGRRVPQKIRFILLALGYPIEFMEREK